MRHFFATLLPILLVLICESNLLGQNLQQLAQNGNTAEIEKAVAAEPAVLDRPLGNGETMLMHAIRNSRTETAKKLIALGANVKILNRQQESVLHIAVQRSSAETVDLILAQNPALDHRDSSGRTPLVMALNHGRREHALRLIKAGCDINIKDRSGRNPLYYASSSGNDKAVELLIDRGADIRATDSNGYSVLMMLCQRGKVDLVKEHFKPADMNQMTKQNQSCLIFAVYSQNLKMIEYICANTDLENTADRNGQTPLQIACQYNNAEVVKVLLKHDADPNVRPSQNHILPPLIHASLMQNAELVNALLAAEADVSLSDHQGNQALHAACGSQSGQFMGQQQRGDSAAKIVTALLENGADPNTKNKAGQTPLALAVATNFPAGIDQLIKVTTDVNIDMGQTSFLHWACENNMPNTISVLLERDATQVNRSDAAGRTPLCIAATGGFDKIVTLLIENEADPNLAGEDGQLPIHCSTAKPSKAMEMLLAAGANAAAVDQSGRSPIQAAGWNGNVDAIRMLAKQSVNLSQATQTGATALHFAVWQGHQPAAELLIDSGIRIDTQDSDGWTPLHKAAHRGNVAMVRMLLERGADKTKTDGIGLTALQKANPKKVKELEPLLK